jgi:hypothetical protein
MQIAFKGKPALRKILLAAKGNKPGNKPSTISREALRMVVNQLGVNLI